MARVSEVSRGFTCQSLQCNLQVEMKHTRIYFLVAMSPHLVWCAVIFNSLGIGG